MAGVLLATALPNRRFIYWQAGLRLAAAAAVAIALGLWLAFAGASPAAWLAGASLLLLLTIVLFIWGSLPLRFLTRRFELYEDGFEAHDRQVTVEQIELLIWQRRVLRIFWCIPTQYSYLHLTCQLKPDDSKQKRGRRLQYSELQYLCLYDCFEEAYEQSIPATYSLTLRPPKPPDA